MRAITDLNSLFGLAGDMKTDLMLGENALQFPYFPYLTGAAKVCQREYISSENWPHASPSLAEYLHFTVRCPFSPGEIKNCASYAAL